MTTYPNPVRIVAEGAIHDCDPRSERCFCGEGQYLVVAGIATVIARFSDRSAAERFASKDRF